jgi:hypothetical protein
LCCRGVVWPTCGNPATRWFRLYSGVICILDYIIVCNVNRTSHHILSTNHQQCDQCKAKRPEAALSSSTSPLGKSPVGSLATSTPEFSSYSLTFHSCHFWPSLLCFYRTFALYGSGQYSKFASQYSFDLYPDHRPITRTYASGNSLRHSARHPDGFVSIHPLPLSLFCVFLPKLPKSLLNINRSLMISYETCATSPYNPAAFHFLSSSGTIIPVCRQQYPRYTHPRTHYTLRRSTFEISRSCAV